MKNNKIRICAAAALTLLAFTLLTCVDQTVKYQQDAVLLSLQIGDVQIQTIPRPITSAQWDSETFGLSGADFGRASFNTKVDTTEKRIIATVNSGSKAEWGIATRGTRPGYFNDIRVPASFVDQDYIYIKVTSDDNETISYYRVYTRFKSIVTDLNSISIQSRVGKAVDGENEWDAEELEAAEIGITVAESQSALIEAVTYDPAASVMYAVVRSGSDAAPSFTASDEPLPLQDQDTLYVKVIAENTIDLSYFKFRVDVGRMATINKLKFSGGVKGELEVFGKGLPTENWDTVTAGTFQTAKNDQPQGGFNVNIEPDDAAATVSFLKYAGADSGTPVFGSNPAKVEFESNDSLAIKVQSVNGGTNYYRVRVTLLAGNIMQHPKSTWYRKGEQAAPLSVVLDPPDTGQYTYQWYESDSWYGIYGRHGYSVDEKANVSCVNGGPGQYFYVVQPDVIPSGGPSNIPQADEPFAWTVGTDPTYTPPTHWTNAPPPGVTANTKPPHPVEPYSPQDPLCYFLQGSTSETRYYWVKVTNTQTGLTVTSDRAVILTETDPTMDHFVFDLSLLPQRKNLVPFTKKNEVYQIDLRDYPFPPGFDPSKYEICIAHAQYFLPDGRPWTQNWTHGDLHFGYTEGTASFKANGGPLTWWHNNMGANSGSIPLQAPHSSRGGLVYKPDWIGFAPSGDPDKGIPAPDPLTGDLPKGIYSMSANDPYPAGVAQGYFAGFIELLEIHFSTAPSN